MRLKIAIIKTLPYLYFCIQFGQKYEHDILIHKEVIRRMSVF
jgi:hypothetical protein